ncbi:MAG: phosphodiesterase [Ruminococcaceae bacterium]|nr:phosphodiesterase [Oscillospiraceae bacterium]
MKLMIASDIHGSAYYCRLLLESFEREGAEKLLLLGDILYHGPRNDLPKEYAPKEVIAMLNPLKERLLCVRGNCDTEVDQMVLDFPVLADYAVLFLDGKTVYATHGHNYNEGKLPPLADGSILLNGHTHVPKCTDHGTYIYMNPGSVSIPKENSPHGYMTVEDGTFLWKDLSGVVYMEYK